MSSTFIEIKKSQSKNVSLHSSLAVAVDKKASFTHIVCRSAAKNLVDKSSLLHLTINDSIGLHLVVILYGSHG